MRENIEDLVVVLFFTVLAFVVGVRVEAVYLHDHEPVECSSEDEVAVELSQDAYGNPVGSRGCVHMDALEILP